MFLLLLFLFLLFVVVAVVVVVVLVVAVVVVVVVSMLITPSANVQHELQRRSVIHILRKNRIMGKQRK